MFGKIVLGIDGELFEHALSEAKKKVKAKLDTELNSEHLKQVCRTFEKIVKQETGKDFPTQPLFEKAGTRPDFLYKTDQVVVYVDGPVHDFPERAERDKQQTAAMEDLGYTVLRFRHDEEWAALVKQYPSVFGTGR